MIFILAKFDTYFTKQGKKNQSKAEMMALSKFPEPTEKLRVVCSIPLEAA